MGLKLSGLHRDMLAEIFNMGMGQAVNAISLLSGKKHEVFFDIPKVDIVKKEDFVNSVNTEEDLGLITQSYYGDLNGLAIMFYPHIKGRELARLLIGTDIPASEIDKLESDALAEVGNIFINSSLASLANFVGSEIRTDLPQIVFSSRFKSHLDKPDELVILIDSSFEIDHMKIEGKIGFVLDNESLENLVGIIDKSLDLIG